MYSILLSRLSDRFGPNGTALAWFESYLKFRRYYIEHDGSIKVDYSYHKHVGFPKGRSWASALCIIHFMYSTEILNP